MLIYMCVCARAFQVVLVVKNLPANAGDVRNTGLIGVRKIPWMKAWLPTHYFVWRIPWTEEPGRLQSIGSQRVRHDWNGLAHTPKVLRRYSFAIPLWLSWLRICLQCRRPGFNPWVGKIPWRREGYPLQNSGLEKPMDSIVHGVTESRIRLSDSLSFGASLVVQWGYFYRSGLCVDPRLRN